MSADAALDYDETSLKNNDRTPGVVEVLNPDRDSRNVLDDRREQLGDLSLPMMKGRPEATMEADTLSAYLSKLSRVAPLPAEKQQELAVRYYEEGDRNAGRLLVLTNLRLVVKLAREYQRRKTHLLELIQQGNMGLCEALTRFDPYKGVKFTSYAQYWIRAMILNYLMNQLATVKLGSSRAGRKLFYNLKKARRELRRQGHKNPTPSLIAEHLDVSEEDVVKVAAQLDAPPVYLDEQVPGRENTTVGDMMADDSGTDPEDLAAQRELGRRVADALQAFGEDIDDDRKRDIWFKRMTAEDRMSLKELGEIWDVSKERIRQVEVQIRKEFKVFLLERLGDDVEIEFLQI